ncbi:hypothetical protein F5Y00DRAFT_128584 [Daldinia vernicosa]|uniref:uncharacterized protein n=1 Tax=Daldinia vernicosa TaxID=114800 RepID=UPI002007F44E|nr:uncharacterized protein F5Y00DRAFT_128584 [Daldinia vernicosa]KAI0846868.1 hypothetical protein F5Y00DRAFT_128584 [Daldinia vernicosa]
MSNSDLSQITSEIPDFIGGLPKRRQPKVPAPPDEFDQYFDYKRFYEGSPAADADSRSRSDASSIPGLTSGPSEEDGASSPRSTEDSFHFKEAVEQIKQHDDRFTVPAREIRPNGVEPYPWHMDIDGTLGSSGAEIQGLGGSSSPLSPASSNGTAQSSYHSSSSGELPLSRGKRHRPLDNPDKVAQMRKIGACFRCKTRKVPCDQQIPCSRCKNDADKYCNDDDGELAEHMCFRRLSASSDLVFHVIWKMKVNPHVTSQRGNPLRWDVYFKPCLATQQPLAISVSRNESNHNNSQTWQRWQANPGQAAPQYVLNPHGAPEDVALIKWASWQMLTDEASDFQSALDVLVSRYAQDEHSFLPYHSLVRKVYDMRCMYKIWRQKKFFCQKYPGSDLEELPRQICQDLKRIIVFRMKTLESDILAQFWKTLDAALKPHERLPLWACMMEFILMYRDIYALNQSEDLCGDPLQIQTITTSVFSNLVVMCEICFGKKKPEAMTEDGGPMLSAAKRQLNADFRRVEIRRDEFYKTVQDCTTYPHSSTLDRLFCVLLIGAQRGGTRAGARASKRARR